MVAHDGTAQEETVIYEGKETKIELGIPFIFFLPEGGAVIIFYFPSSSIVKSPTLKRIVCRR